jgi:ketosteroid isomerase-like protein
LRDLSYVLAFLVLALAVGGAHSTGDHPLTSTELTPQNELDAKFVEGMNLKDVDKVMRCFWNSPDLILVLADGTVIRGWANVKRAVEQLFTAHESVSLTIDDVSYVRSGDGIVAVGTATFRMRPKDGPAYQFTERWTDLRRNLGGRWVYVLDHAHALPPPKTPGS